MVNMEKHADLKRRVIKTYLSPIVRLYCTIRFLIMNMRILDEIGQYLPENGRILDVGCGFGLFSLYYALQSGGRQVEGCDISKQRITMAQSSATRLGLGDRIIFSTQDAVGLRLHEKQYDAIYMLDIVHHIKPSEQVNVLHRLCRVLSPGGILIVKDIDRTPVYKLAFTWMLDMLMSPREPPHYLSSAEVVSCLTQAGLDVKVHSMPDILPYPHILYVCRKPTLH